LKLEKDNKTCKAIRAYISAVDVRLDHLAAYCLPTNIPELQRYMHFACGMDEARLEQRARPASSLLFETYQAEQDA
jgi:hypothetical protein